MTPPKPLAAMTSLKSFHHLGLVSFALVLLYLLLLLRYYVYSPKSRDDEPANKKLRQELGPRNFVGNPFAKGREGSWKSLSKNKADRDRAWCR
jgi:hypothetical protein